jgi:hypothetical protein
MALSDDIRALRDRSLADLNSIHDYHVDTMVAWEVVHEVIAAGTRFTVRNRATGTVSTQGDLAARATGYISE